MAFGLNIPGNQEKTEDMDSRKSPLLFLHRIFHSVLLIKAPKATRADLAGEPIPVPARLAR